MSVERLVFINARGLYEQLKLKRQFSNWITEKIKAYNLELNEDYMELLTPLKSTLFNNFNTTGRPKTEYILTQEAADLIAKGKLNINIGMSDGFKRHKIQNLLKNWLHMDKEISDIKGEIDDLQNEIPSISLPDGIEYKEGLKSGKIADETFEKAGKIEMLSQRLDLLIERYQELKEDYMKLQKAIFKLDYQERLLIEYRYYNDWQWYIIAKELNIAETNCKRYVGEIIDKLVLNFEW